MDSEELEPDFEIGINPSLPPWEQVGASSEGKQQGRGRAKANLMTQGVASAKCKRRSTGSAQRWYERFLSTVM